VEPRFRILEHPADVGIEVYGQSLAEMFENAAEGLLSLIVDRTSIQTTQRRRIAIHSVDVENLLVRWLNELLYLYDAEGFLVAKAQIEKISETSLRGFVFGEKYDDSRHELKQDVKAVTYHQLEVKKEQNWRARIFFDV
jgi:SHS2 domain-containing protein